MARRSTGQVVERQTKRGTVYALRFYVGGERQYETLGSADDGWNRRRAEDELASVMAAVRAGSWQPSAPVVAPEPRRAEPTFHEFASEWLDRRRPELRPKTIVTYSGTLSLHLLPWFAAFGLSAITAEEIDRYAAAKLRENVLGRNQVNKTLVLLAAILEDAVDYGYLSANPARGRRRRVKGTKPRRTVVEPEQLMSLLEASGRLRPLVATLAGAGLRCGEACALDWRDVNLATGTIRVRESKTDAGAGREIDLPDALREELAEVKARAHAAGPDDPVFTTRAREGKISRQTVSNIGRRLKTAIRRANDRLAELEIEPISEHVSPHSLRRSYASIRYALKDDPITVASQMGHEKPDVSMEIYAKALKRREKLRGAYLHEYDRALNWALIGTGPTAADERFVGLDDTDQRRAALQSHTSHQSPRSSAG